MMGNDRLGETEFEVGVVSVVDYNMNRELVGRSIAVIGFLVVRIAEVAVAATAIGRWYFLSQVEGIVYSLELKKWPG